MFNFSFWAQTLSSAVTVTALLGLAIYLWRDLVAKYLVGLLQHKFDADLEKLRSELRQAEEIQKSEIRATENELKTIITAALSARSNWQTALDARRLQAVDNLWAAKCKLDQLRPAAVTIASMNYPVALAESNKSEEVRRLFETYATVLNKPLQDAKISNAETERPFITSVVWATFVAYQAVLVMYATMLQMLASGTGKMEFLNIKYVDDLLKNALPQHSQFVERYSYEGYYPVLDILEQKLLTNISEMLEGKTADAGSLERAAEIVRTANKMWSPQVDTPKIPSRLRKDGPEFVPDYSDDSR